MRSTWFSSLVLLFFFFSGVSSASTITFWSPGYGVRSATAYAACKSSYPESQCATKNGQFCGTEPGPTDLNANCKKGDGTYFGDVYKSTLNCEFGNTGSYCNASCVAPNVMQDGQCSAPVDPCASKLGQATTWRKEYPDQAAYDKNPIREIASQGGCGVAVGSLECGTSGSTGKFGCWGTGTYSGNKQADSDGSGVADCGPTCKAPDPTTTNNSNSCTAPAVNNGTTSYTCITESNADQFSSSNCASGTVNGVTGLHCTKPDYVPESDNKTVQDKVTETPKTPAGTGSTVVKESTVTSTKCKQGVCTTTTTTTTTTTGKDGTGAVTDEGTACSGDKCDNPATPEDESQEEEGEEVERTVAGESCGSNLSCDGDAIDCAMLKQQKDLACSLDWETQKGQVLAEAAKSEYQLGTEEINSAGFFSGPSSSRWLSASCPPDRAYYLETTNSTVVFSWSYVCQYATNLGYLLVALASLFFAVYVGRAFGG